MTTLTFFLDILIIEIRIEKTTINIKNKNQKRKNYQYGTWIWLDENQKSSQGRKVILKCPNRALEKHSRNNHKLEIEQISK